MSVLIDVVRRNRAGHPAGMFSVCSANPWVLRAAADFELVCIESTSNQVNQFGGYTGQTPAGFAAMVRAIKPHGLILGGDHLGPYPWRGEPAADAMEKACELVRQCVRAGYSKIHLDASMSCGGDPAGALDERVIAARTAQLCRAAEEAREGGAPPLYVVGTEVPAPGGEPAEGEPPAVTRPEDIARTLYEMEGAFRAAGLEDAWTRVIGLVVQPGVEFGDTVIFDYDRGRARALAAGLPQRPELVYEAHSTDYQTSRALGEMVQDHFAILKVGPWLTFAFRECVFALSAIEREWLGGRRGVRLSRVRETLEAAMLANPAHWKPYYRGDDHALALARMYSFSDRCRYYWPDPAVRAELDLLMANLSAAPMPLALVSQYLPEQYRRVRAGVITNGPEEFVRDRIGAVLEIYSGVCRQV
ncbi:MAG: class II D-tagatose-bisphosphate aldolase non-catalytic subunit [Bryobacteraceae bacterium]